MVFWVIWFITAVVGGKLVAELFLISRKAGLLGLGLILTTLIAGLAMGTK